MAATPPSSASPPGADRSAVASARSRASALIDLGRPQDALKAAEEGLAGAPGDAPLLRLRALALQGVGRPYDAIEAATAAIAAAPNEPNGFVVRSSILTTHAKSQSDAAGRREVARRASEDAAQAARLAPYLAGAHRQLAEALAYAGEPERAWAAARKAAELDPDSEATWVTLSVVGIAGGGDPVAIEVVARRALSINPLSYAALNNLGVALMQQGRKREAAPLLRQAAASNPGRDTAVDNLAKVGTSVIRLAVLAAVSGLFLTPLGAATIFVLLLAAAVLFRPWATKKMRSAAIKAALALPQLRLPSTTTLLGVSAVGVAAYTLADGGSKPLGIGLLAGGAATIIYAPARMRLRRARIARRGLDEFPKRAVRSRLSRSGGRSIRTRPIVVTVWLGITITSAIIHHHSDQSTSSLPQPFPFASIPLPPVTTQPVDPSDPATLIQPAALPRGFAASPAGSGALTAAQVASDFGTSSGMQSAYRQAALSTDRNGNPDPGGQVLTETAVAFTSPAQAAAFVRSAITRAGTPAATHICGDVYLAAPAGRDRATMYVIDGNDVVAAELSHDATASSDLTTQSQGLVLILPGLTDAGCNN